MTDHRALYEEVGRRIRDARRQRKPKLTQDALAKLVSLTRTSITNIEKGRQNFLFHTFADIAAALQVDPATLLPDSKTSTTDLDKALKNRPQSEQEFIKSAVTAVRQEKTMSPQSLGGNNGT